MFELDIFTFLTNFEKHHTGKLVPNSQKLASLMTDAQLWDQCTHLPHTDCYYEAPEIDLDFDGAARVWGSIDSVLGEGESGVADPTYQLDYRLAAGTYDGFEDWALGTVTLRYAKARLHVETSLGVLVISSMTARTPTLKITSAASISTRENARRRRLTAFRNLQSLFCIR